MGFFRKLGRQVEQFKHSANEAVDEETDYECQACGEQFSTQPDRCPECGSGDIVATGSA